MKKKLTVTWRGGVPKTWSFRGDVIFNGPNTNLLFTSTKTVKSRVGNYAKHNRTNKIN